MILSPSGSHNENENIFPSLKSPQLYAGLGNFHKSGHGKFFDLEVSVSQNFFFFFFFWQRDGGVYAWRHNTFSFSSLENHGFSCLLGQFLLCTLLCETAAWNEDSPSSCVIKNPRLPVQVRCMKQGTQSQCSGTTQKDRVGRKVGVGFRIGGHRYTCSWFMLMFDKNRHNILK